MEIGKERNWIKYFFGVFRGFILRFELRVVIISLKYFSWKPKKTAEKLKRKKPQAFQTHFLLWNTFGYVFFSTKYIYVSMRTYRLKIVIFLKIFLKRSKKFLFLLFQQKCVFSSSSSNNLKFWFECANPFS